MSDVENVFHNLGNPATWYGAVFYAIAFLLMASLAARAVKIGANRLLKRNDLVDRTVVLFLTQFLQIIVYILALVFYFHVIPALNKLGTALLTGVSVMSVVFGLAAQNTLSNLVAGVTLLLYRPFHLDDLMQIAAPTGTEVGIVERLTLGYTMLRTLDDRLVVVPNSLMASQVSLNLNRGSVHAMMILQVGVMERAHAEAVREALLEEAKKNPRIHRVIGCMSKPLEDNGVILSLRGWCVSKEEAEQAKQEILAEVQQRVTPENIDLMASTVAPVRKAAA